MNLNHLEALALVQKVAFALPEKYFAHVEVAVLPPFTDIRSVQTLIDGDKLKLVHGAQDLSPHDSGAYTGDVSGSMLAKLGCRYVVVGHSSAARSTARPTRPSTPRCRRPSGTGSPRSCASGRTCRCATPAGHVAHCSDQLSAALAGVAASTSGRW
jgi:triosephosphate isomerase